MNSLLYAVRIDAGDNQLINLKIVCSVPCPCSPLGNGAGVAI